jgi:mycothiol maleylpyruvate isomerase-like protein
MDGPFLAGAHVVADLLSRDEVVRQWSDDSKLPRMTVGMLACHLGRQLVAAERILPVPAESAPLDEAADHYRRAAWVTAESLDDPANDRTTDEREAAAGHEALLDRTTSALDTVTHLLTTGTAQPVVTIPWQGWSLRRADFLLTRLVEIVVHTDDLARSLAIATPEFPAPTYRPVLHLLADLATERHGQATLTSALSRHERQPSNLSAF